MLTRPVRIVQKPNIGLAELVEREVRCGNNLLSENKTDIMTRKRKLLFIMAGIFILLVISYISISLYYNTHFYMNTTINGIETSNMTVEQAEGGDTKRI